MDEKQVKVAKLTISTHTICNLCGGKMGAVGDCWRCTKCESLPVKKDPFQD
jgi:tRNA(Ile2) C34 agmatinyltransferase TiaS